MPPPIPRPVGYASFYGKSVGFIGSNHSVTNLESAQQQAVHWMNSNPGIEIIKINTCLTDHLAAVTVWYRS